MKNTYIATVALLLFIAGCSKSTTTNPNNTPTGPNQWLLGSLTYPISWGATTTSGAEYTSNSSSQYGACAFTFPAGLPTASGTYPIVAPGSGGGVSFMVTDSVYSSFGNHEYASAASGASATVTVTDSTFTVAIPSVNVYNGHTGLPKTFSGNLTVR